MHVYLRSVPVSRLNVIAAATWPMATAWCGKHVRFSETVNLRGRLMGVEICEACANAIEHGEPARERLPLPRSRPYENAEERDAREEREEREFAYRKVEGLL